MFFGEKLQSVRELNGLSRKELADKLGLSAWKDSRISEKSFILLQLKG